MFVEFSSANDYPYLVRRSVGIAMTNIRFTAYILNEDSNGEYQLYNSLYSSVSLLLLFHFIAKQLCANNTNGWSSIYDIKDSL